MAVGGRRERRRRRDPERDLRSSGVDGMRRNGWTASRNRWTTSLECAYLRLEGIEHRSTRVGRPRSNGFIERFHRTLLEERLRIKDRTTWSETLEEMQKDIDGYLETNNTHRHHRGHGMERTTP